MDREIILRAIAREKGVPYEQLVQDPQYGSMLGTAPAVQDVDPVQPPALPAPVVQAPPPVVQAPPVVQPPVVEGPPPPVVDPWAPDAQRGVPQSVEDDQSFMQRLKGAATEVDEIANQRADAAVRMGDAESRSAQRAVRLYEDNQPSREEERLRSVEAGADAEYRARIAKFDKLNEEASAMPPIQEKTSAWAAIALAFSGLGDALKEMGGQHGNSQQQVMQQLNASAERDIRIQMENRKGKRDAAQAALSEIDLARRYLGDTREAHKYAVGLRKDRLADAMANEANKLTQQTARERAIVVAGGLRQEAKKEQLDVLQDVLKSKTAALQAYKMGLIGKDEFQAAWAAGGDDAGEAPASRVPGGALTKTQTGKVNLDTYQNEVPGIEWLVDPAQVTPEDRQAVQKIKSATDRVVTVVSKAREAYAIASDKSRSDQERLSALGRYRTLVESQLPGYVSQATGSGTPQEGEAQRLLRSLPPAPVINDVAGVREAKQDLDNWLADRSMNPAAFDYFVDDFFDIASDGMAANKGRLTPPGTAASASAPAPARASGGGGGAAAPKPKPAPGAAGGKPKPKPKAAVATSPEDFD